MGILPSHLSRVSNFSVLQQARWTKASTSLERRQLELLGKIIRSGPDSALWPVSFTQFGLSATYKYVRRVGRPRKEWIPTVMPNALRLVDGGWEAVEAAVQNKIAWKQRLRSECCR